MCENPQINSLKGNLSKNKKLNCNNLLNKSKPTLSLLSFMIRGLQQRSKQTVQHSKSLLFLFAAHENTKISNA